MNNKEQEIQCCVTNCDNPLNGSYWEAQWQSGKTGWDIGYASPAINNYMAQYGDKDATILIPGCGNAYEAANMAENGFTNITLLDISPKAAATLQAKFANSPAIKVLCEDFFEHHGLYDLILEQTFFCAIPPSRREEYAKKAASLLRPHGKVVGLLFDKVFEKAGPPFGGCPCEYKPIFAPHFTIQRMEACYNSIPQRAGAEVFINLVKR